MRSGNRRLNSGVPPRQPGRSRHRPGSTSVSSFRASSTRSKETKATFSNTEVGGRADLVRAGHMLARREYMHQTGRTSCTSGHLPCLASHRIASARDPAEATAADRRRAWYLVSLYDVSRPQQNIYHHHHHQLPSAHSTALRFGGCTLACSEFSTLQHAGRQMICRCM